MNILSWKPINKLNTDTQLKYLYNYNLKNRINNISNLNTKSIS